MKANKANDEQSYRKLQYLQDGKELEKREMLYERYNKSLKNVRLKMLNYVTL